MKLKGITIPNKIANEKGLQNIDLSKKELGAVVALVGKNGSGKTRILDFVESYFSIVDPISVLSNLTNLPIQFDKRLESLLSRVTQTAPNFKVNYTELVPILSKYIKKINSDEVININNNLDTNLSFEKILQGATSVNTTVPTTPRSNIIPKSNIVTASQTSSMSPLKPINEFNQLTNHSTIKYINALTTDLVVQEFTTFSKTKGKWEDVQASVKSHKSHTPYGIIKKYIESFLGHEFTYESTQNGTTLGSSLLLNGKPFNLEQLSPGQKILLSHAILFFYLEISDNVSLKDCIIIIDEPEKHLHPEAQIKLIDALRSIVKARGQLWIATHSVHILAHLDYNEINLVKNDTVISPSQTTPSESLIELMGLEDHISELSTFVSNIADWYYAKYILQCFKEPDIVYGINIKDPQYKLLKGAISSRTIVKMLDFGAGKGRIGATLATDTEINSNIDYYAYEPYSKESFIPSNNLKQLYVTDSEIEKNFFNVVVLCNVLHEINPREWKATFEVIKEALADDGVLIMLEDMILPNGESAHEFGFLLYDSLELQSLFQIDDILSITPEDSKYRDRLKLHLIPQKDINVSDSSIIESLHSLKLTSYNKMKLLRSPTNIDNARKYALQSQLFVNATIALEALSSHEGQ